MDDGLDRDDEGSGTPLSKINKKKILMIILPVIILIGLAVSFYTVFTRNDQKVKNYSIVSREDSEGTAQTVIFYDLPEITAAVPDDNGTATAKLRISLETTGLTEEKISFLDGLSSKIQDIVIAHIVELSPDELSGSENLYWLKEELLYRINLVTAPVKINGINFKGFEIQNDHQQG